MSPERRGPDQSFDLELIAQIAKETLLKDGHHIPTVIADGDNGPIYIPMTPFPTTHEGRQQWMRMAGFGLAQTGAANTLWQVFFISEGWMSVFDGGKPPDQSPSQDPDRIEVLFIYRLTIQENQTKVVMFEMIRDEEERLMDLKTHPLPGGEGAEAQSPLLDAFVLGFRTGRSGKVN